MIINYNADLSEWVNLPLILKCKHGPVMGFIAYGVRLPIRPGNEPLHRCDVGSTEEIEGQIPSYWYLSDDEDVKIKIIGVVSQSEDTLEIRAHSQNYFDASIMKMGED